MVTAEIMDLPLLQEVLRILNSFGRCRPQQSIIFVFPWLNVAIIGDRIFLALRSGQVIGVRSFALHGS